MFTLKLLIKTVCSAIYKTLYSKDIMMHGKNLGERRAKRMEMYCEKLYLGKEAVRTFMHISVHLPDWTDDLSEKNQPTLFTL